MLLGIYAIQLFFLIEDAGCNLGQLWLRRWRGSSTTQKVGSVIPGTCSLHAKVSLGKILNPKLPLMALLAVYG